MAKNIAFFADGTWNGTDTEDENRDGIADLTNVLKMFCSVAGSQTLDTTRLQDEQELVATDDNGTPVQVAKYIHGVGDSRNPLSRLFGGAFGSGVIQRIVRGYTFISRHYEAGDRIYITGFSRGAYTARALGGMIASVGLLDAKKLDLGDRIDAYRYGIAAWVQYRRNSHKVDSMLDALEQSEAKAIPPGAMLADVPIRAIGVWDTVGSLGLPLYLGGERYDLFKFADDVLSDRVTRGIHAVSIDERRGDFAPTLWKAAANVTQAGFIGAHADVGGGYPEHGLSDIALDWMTRELGAQGLQFLPRAPYQPAPDRLQAIHEPWREGVFRLGRKDPRDLGKMTPKMLHDSVRLRVKALPGYRPQSLIDAGFMDAAGNFAPGVRFVV